MTQIPDEPRPLPASMRDESPPMVGRTVDDLFAELAANTLDKPATPRDRLRELPTVSRMLLAMAGVTGLAGTYLGIRGLRPDLLTTEELIHYLLMAGVCVAVGVGSAAVSLRAAHARPLHENAWRLGALAVALPLVLSVIPGALPGVAHDDFLPWSVHLSCGVGGLAAGLVSAAAVLVFSREDEPSGWRVLAAAGAGGVFGFVIQSAHCPAVDISHLVISHALYGIAIWGMLALALYARRA